MWGEGGGFVVGIETCSGVPEELVSCCFDGRGFGCPGCDGGAVIKNRCETDTLVDGVVEDCVGFDVLLSLV